MLPTRSSLGLRTMFIGLCSLGVVILAAAHLGGADWTRSRKMSSVHPNPELH